MTILVDECRWRWRDRLWCHLVSDDSFDELHEFAPRLGLPRRAFQGDHYDLDEGLREVAVHLGALPVNSRVIVQRLRSAGLRRRSGQTLGTPQVLPTLPNEHLPLVLARFHRLSAVGQPLEFHEPVVTPPSPDVLRGAGFIESDTGHWVRDRTLADTVAPSMRVLICGLNPSLVAADAGYGFAGPTNRFWKAALASGLTDRAADPVRALLLHRVGMTDLVKRATPRSSELSKLEYQDGTMRVRRLVEWLRPSAVCFVGLEGWRASVDRGAAPGWQSTLFADVPAYVMPSTSGLNARVSLSDLAEHLREVLALTGT